MSLFYAPDKMFLFHRELFLVTSFILVLHNDRESYIVGNSLEILHSYN